MLTKKTVFSTLLVTVINILPVQAEPVSPSQVPSFVPSGALSASRYNQNQPSGWSSVTPWGEAINTASKEGYVEIAHWEMICQVNGSPTTVVSGLQNIGAGFYLAQPWYGGDQHSLFQPQITENGLHLPVRAGTVTHWWLNRRPRVENAQNCQVTARVRMSEGVLVGVGGDWWINQTAGWAGQDVNNRYLGRSDWHNYEGGWQTIRF
jgi:hypothetical protein